MRPIGVIQTPFKARQGIPIQPAHAGDTKGRVVVYPEYADGLKDIGGFSHINLIYYFHLACETGEVKLLRKPFLDDAEHGIFAIRHYARPNPIGLSAVRLLGVDANVLEVEGIDVVDGTPLLDIKPYVPGFRAPGPVRTGWLEGGKKTANQVHPHDDE